MMRNEKVLVKVPASTANLGPGFDTLGMALELFAWVEMSFSDRAIIHLYGDGMDGIPTDESNLVYRTALKVFQKAGIDCPGLEISMLSEIPLARGLGSSASAIVGALVAANHLAGDVFSKEQLFQMAVEIEHHPDNVGASLFGGLVVVAWDGGMPHYLRLDVDSAIEVLAAIPEFQLSTEQARNILPQQVSRQDAVYNISRASLLVSAFSLGKLDLIRDAMSDKLHQPYRSSLIPGMQDILNGAADHGALGAALSGAGPTLLALVNKDSRRKQELIDFIEQTLQQYTISAEYLWLNPADAGASVLTQNNNSSTFIEKLKGELRA